jgi:hypothetical protein
MEEAAMTQPRAYHKRVQRARQKRAHQAKQKRFQRTRERLQQEEARAPRTLRALEQAIAALGLPETIAAEVQRRRQAQQPLVGKIVGMTFPPGVWLPQLS